MRYFKKIFCVILCFAILFPIGLSFSGCSADSDEAYILSIKKSDIESNDNTDVYIIQYSDGTSSTFTVSNGKDGEDGASGKDGKDGAISIEEVYDKYNEYLESNGEEPISYSEFLKLYLKADIDYSVVINSTLNTSLKLYSEFIETKTVTNSWGIATGTTTSRAIYGGSGVIYKIEQDYTYILTNYHVVYSEYSNSDNKISYKIGGYMYGSEGSAKYKMSGNQYVTDNYGNQYDYEEGYIEFEYVGGSLEYDIAILKTETTNITSKNQNAKAIEFADGYNVGEMCFAIGNSEGYGLSATQGIVSVDSEYIEITIGGKDIYYRLLRMDTAIYHGNSGGGLFNKNGKLIGITNAGNNNDQNINYSIPVNIVKSVTENLMSNYDGTNPSKVKKIKLGIKTGVIDSSYALNSETGFSEIVEKITVKEFTDDNVIGKTSLGLNVDDVLTKFYIKKSGETEYTEYKLKRNFSLELLIDVRAGDCIKIQYNRGGTLYTSNEYIVDGSDLNEVE